MSLKKGLMTQFPYARGRAFVCKNIGDYVQAVATRQFVDPIDEYVEQEEADKYYPDDRRKIRLVMNGWFQWRAENWPPSEYIEPLLISMHISPLRAKELLTDDGIRFLKNHSPVGCRDYYTKELLESHGISAYFSGCMTLTLGKNYRVDDDKRDGICIVDPYFEIPPIIELKDENRLFHIRNFLIGAWDIIRFLPYVLKLGKRSFFKEYMPTGFLDRSNSRIRPYYKAAEFFKIYSKKFSKCVLINAKYITHWIDVDMSGRVTNDDLLSKAEELIKIYAASKMVITSRIHAGLPCLGVGTPVIFIANDEVVSENGTFNTPGRLGGLIELFRILKLDAGVFSTDDSVLNEYTIIDENTSFSNKDDWKKYADELAIKVTDFMKD